MNKLGQNWSIAGDDVLHWKRWSRQTKVEKQVVVRRDLEAKCWESRCRSTYRKKNIQRVTSEKKHYIYFSVQTSVFKPNLHKSLKWRQIQCNEYFCESGICNRSMRVHRLKFCGQQLKPFHDTSITTYHNITVINVSKIITAKTSKWKMAPASYQSGRQY